MESTKATFLRVITVLYGLLPLTAFAQARKYPGSSASHATDDFSRGVPGIVFGVFAVLVIIAIFYIWQKIQEGTDRIERLKMIRGKSKEELRYYVQHLHQEGQSIAKISDTIGMTEYETRKLLEK